MTPRCDLAAQRMALAAALAERGEEVLTVGSGAEALWLLLESDVAVILLDVNMPDMDGLETAGLIRQRPRTRHTPIIVLTADTDEMLLPWAYALGAVDFILNPFLPEILRAKVPVFVELSKLHERVRREADQRIALSQAHAARAAAEGESRRLGFLAEVGAVLSRSLDAPTLVRELLELFVPRLVDLAAGALADGDRELCWRAVEAEGSAGTASPPDGEGMLLVAVTGYGQTLVGRRRARSASIYTWSSRSTPRPWPTSLPAPLSALPRAPWRIEICNVERPTPWENDRTVRTPPPGTGTKGTGFCSTRWPG